MVEMTREILERGKLVERTRSQSDRLAGLLTYLGCNKKNKRRRGYDPLQRY